MEKYNSCSKAPTSIGINQTASYWTEEPSSRLMDLLAFNQVKFPVAATVKAQNTSYKYL